LKNKYQINWERGKISIIDKTLRDINNFCCIICGDWAPINNTFNLQRNNEMSIFGNLDMYFKNSDFNILNIECVIANDGKKIIKAGPHLKCRIEKLNILEDTPFHLACLANNHARDYGDEGLLNTISLLKEIGLDTVGAGKKNSYSQKPYKLQNDCCKLAIINAAEGEAALPVNCGPGVASFDLSRVAFQIKELKRKGFFVIGIFHVGREFVPIPPVYIYESFHFLADSGIDMIIGHHPHIVQGIEIYYGVPIFYSIGNFLFYQKTDNPLQHLGMMLQCHFSKKKLQTIKIIPYKINKNSINSLDNIEEKRFFNDIKILSIHLNDYDVTEFWNYYCSLFDVDDLLPSKKLKKTNQQEYYARIINRIETPAHRNLMISSAKIKLNGLEEYSKWVVELCSKYKIVDEEMNLISRFYNKIRKKLKLNYSSK